MLLRALSKTPPKLDYILCKWGRITLPDSDAAKALPPPSGNDKRGLGLALLLTGIFGTKAIQKKQDAAEQHHTSHKR